MCLPFPYHSNPRTPGFTGESLEVCRIFHVPNDHTTWQTKTLRTARFKRLDTGARARDCAVKGILFDSLVSVFRLIFGVGSALTRRRGHPRKR